MEFDKINFKLNDFLQPVRKYNKSTMIERRFWKTPEELLVLCKNVIDPLPYLECTKWINMNVLIWIEELGFPQYKVKFYIFCLNRYKLLSYK